MSYLKFDKTQLVNLEYSLQREILRTNRAGSYCCTTLSGCNTRKYHGLLICPMEHMDGGKHVLLSSLDETVVQRGAEFNLGIHKYAGEHYEPKGHKYIRAFETDVIPITTFHVGGVVLTKERLVVEGKQQILIKYTLVEAHSPTTLRFKPFLAFRNVHSLSHANMDANTKFHPIENGIKIQLYDGYPFLHMQLSGENEFVPIPDWYQNIEYFKEQTRGYDCHEDLYVPGYFEIPIKKGESIIFSASTSEENSKQLKQQFTTELKKKTPRDSFFGCLRNSAHQLVVNSPNFTDVQAGYPWYNGRVAQTFVALPGLSLTFDKNDWVSKILQSNIARLNNGLFPAKWGRHGSNYDSADAPLWFFWTLQQLRAQNTGTDITWQTYKPVLMSILNAYKAGTDFNIKMQHNGLINAEKTGVALTWMNAYIDGQPVTPRYGMPVEINALWYNALRFALELATENSDQEFIQEWTEIANLTEKSFIETFWNEEKGYLADYVNHQETNWQVRPNQVIAAALQYSPLTKEMKKSILSLAKKELLTPRGLRSLSPRDPLYKGLYEGSEAEREAAIHQGTVFPWLVGFFIEGYLKIHKLGGLSFVKQIIDGFEEEMNHHCIGTISELYNGNPPHKGKGAISQAWNIGEILRAQHIIALEQE
jgi:predicted glycogen debranching enzyme